MAPRTVSVTKKKKVVEEKIKVVVTDGDPNVTTETDTQETQDLSLPIPVEEENITRVGHDGSPQSPETPVPANRADLERKPDLYRTYKNVGPILPASEGTMKETHKVEKKQGKKKKMIKKRKRSDVVGDEYKRYVYKVMKQVHPELGITSKAMTVINMFMGDMFERIAEEAARLSGYTKRRTLSSREIEAAVRLVLPGELSRHAVAEGSKAISNYVAYDARKR